MKLKEAIEILTLDKTCDYEGPGQDLEDALQLGIEAMKREIKNRQGTFSIPLPGETEE